VSDSPGEERPAPDLAEALKELGATGRAGRFAAGDAAKALRILVAADISLARSAFGRTLALTGVAIAFGASAWLLLTAVLSVAITLFAGWRAMRYFEHTRLKATRRQFARLGLGELADFMPDADSAAPTADAAERMAEATTAAPVKKGLGVDVTPP
jgi:hypothetical protein